MLDDPKLAEQLEKNWKTADLSDGDRAMLRYAEKLTITPWDMVERDVLELRKNGFVDSAILDINQVTAYYAYANRLVDGLGVEIEGIHSNN